MKNIIKLTIIALTTLFVMLTAIHAAPVITDVNIDKTNGQDVILVSFENTNVSPGVYTGLSFKIDELGTTKDFGIIKVDSNQVLQYKLSDITDSYNLLKKGSTYTVVVNTDSGSKSKSFLFGNYKDTTGLGIVLDRVDVNNVEVKSQDTLQVLNGETINVDLKISALESFDNARFMVYIDGYEHSPIVASTDIFSVVAGTTYIKNLEIKLPSDMVSTKNYKLRISGANDLSGNTYKDFNVYVDTQRNRVDIVDLIMTPSSAVEAGQNIIANVRMKNRGQKAQDSVKVIVEIPELGISESSYISNLATIQTITSDDMLLFIPENAKPKNYEVKVTLQYNDGYESKTRSFPINIVAAKVVPKSSLLVNFKDNMNLVAGETTSFPLIIANPNKDSRPISIGVLDNTWADVQISPSLAMVKGGDSQTYTVTVTPKVAILGEKELRLNIKDGSTVISDLKVKTYVATSNKISWTNLVLVVLLIVAIIVLLFIVIRISKKRNEDDNEDEITSSKEYY